MNFKFENNIFKGDECKFNYVMGIGEALFQILQQHGDKIVQIEDYSQTFDTYASLLKKCIRTAIELRNRNIGKGDIVAISCCEHINTCVPIIASHFNGAIPFVADIAYPHVWDKLKKLKPKFMFCHKDSESIVKNFLRKSDYITFDVVVFGSSFEAEFLVSQTNEEEIFRPTQINDLFETCAIFYTAGDHNIFTRTGYFKFETDHEDIGNGTTAGTPNLICLNHYNLLQLFRKRNSNTPHVLVSNIPWSWFGADLIFFQQFVNGDTRILCRGFYSPMTTDYDVNTLLKSIEEYKADSLVVNYQFAVTLLKVEKTDYDLSSVKMFLTGGSPLLDEYYKKIKTIFPNAITINKYGSTEAGSPFEFNLDDNIQSNLYQEKLHSVGLPISGYCLKVVDLNTEKALGPNQIGELRLKSKYLISNGYFNKDEWVKCFDEDGWFKTGDLIYFDEQFRFFVKDRIKFIINSNGTRIFPAHMESVMIQHTDVKEVAVIGVPSAVKTSEYLTTEDPVAVVVLKDGANISSEDLLNYFNENLPNDMSNHACVSFDATLTGGVIIVDSLPVNAFGKVMKVKLKEMVINKLNLK